MTDAELEELERLIQRLAITPTNLPLSDWCQLSDGVLSLLSTIRTLKAEVEKRDRHNEALIKIIRDASKAEETCKQLAGIRSSWAGRDPAACVLIAKAEEKLAVQAALIHNTPALTTALSALDQEDTP